MIAQATADGSGYVRLWDTETLKEFARLSRHRGAIDGVLFAGFFGVDWSVTNGDFASPKTLR